MDEKQLYPKYRFVMSILIILTLGFTMFTTYISSALLILISKEFGIAVANAGYTTTLTTLIGGLTMFAATAIIGKLDIKKTMILSVSALLTGNIITVAAPAFILMLIGRAFIGIAFGLTASSFGAILAAWLPPKERPAIVTVNSFAAMGFITVCFAAAIPLTNMFGGNWTGPFIVCAIAAAVLLLAWIFFGRDNKAFNEYQKELKEKAAAEGKINQAALTKKENGLLEAIKLPVVWKLTGLIALSTIAGSAISLYLPTFLTTIRNINPGVAATYTGFITLAGMAGTFLGGTLTTAIGKRKPIIIPGVFLAVLTLFIILSTHSAGLLVAAILVYGFSGSVILPATTVIITEIKDITPAAITGGYSFIKGVGQVFSFFIPSIVAVLTGVVGFTNSLFVFFGMYAVAALCSLLIKETGPKRKIKQSE